MKYAIIKEYEEQHSKALMCRVMRVSRTGYANWCKGSICDRDKRRQLMTAKVLETYEDFEAGYGSRRIAKELNDLGYPCSENYIANIMKSQGIRARNGKGFKYSRHSLTMVNVSENLLWRDFNAKHPNEKWTTDITYIWVKDKWLYLATVMDLYSRCIVGWALDETMTEALVTQALSVALARRKPKPGLILHSDRGVQYRAQGYVDFVANSQLKQSMSRKGNCWDNAPMESFFSRLKVELIYAKNYQSMDEARTGIFTYIEVFYNRKRRHSAIGNISPVEFENRTALVA